MNLAKWRVEVRKIADKVEKIRPPPFYGDKPGSKLDWLIDWLIICNARSPTKLECRVALLFCSFINKMSHYMMRWCAMIPRQKNSNKQKAVNDRFYPFMYWEFLQNNLWQFSIEKLSPCVKEQQMIPGARGRMSTVEVPGLPRHPPSIQLHSIYC